MKFYGRSNEIAVLKRELALSEARARFAIVSGRRRIGKTTLIREAVKDCGRPVFYFQCTSSCTEEMLARVWLDEIRRTFDLATDAGPRRLTAANIVRLVMRLSKEKPCVMILDECQALSFAAPAF